MNEKDLQKTMNTLLNDDKLMYQLRNQFKDNPDLLANTLYNLCCEIAEDMNPYEDDIVTPYEFLHSPEFCGHNYGSGNSIIESMHPKLQDEFIKMHSQENEITEAILTGGIGWGKSYLLSVGLIWQVYKLSKFKSPQRYFKLDQSSKLSIMIISLTEEQSKKNVFHDVKEMIRRIPYFQNEFPFNEKKDASSLLFPKNIELFNGNSSEASAIGLHIYSACIDEANFFKVVRNSKRGRRYGEVYDQAQILYNSLIRRQESRFLKEGKRPGILYLASSKLFPNDFIEKRIKAIRTAENEGLPTHAHVLDYNLWTVKREAYCKEEFQVEVSEVKKRARILTGNETDIDGRIINIPMDFYGKFKLDLDSALRDLAGVAIYSTQPYLTQRDKVLAVFDKNMPKVFSVDEASLSTKENISAYEYILGNIVDKEKPRFVALDIGIKHDACGFAMGYVDKLAKIEREYVDPESGTIKKTYETAPYLVVEMVLRIVPDSEVGEVQLSDVRHLIFRLKAFGYNIIKSSADGFQSVDMSQILKRKGIDHKAISMDVKTNIPYDTFKEAMYEGRVRIVDHPHLQEELLSLEKSYETGKVDHPPQGTKDLADAVGQVVYHLTVENPNLPIDLLPSGIELNKYDGQRAKTEEEILAEFTRWATEDSNLIKVNKVVDIY